MVENTLENNPDPCRVRPHVGGEDYPEHLLLSPDHLTKVAKFHVNEAPPSQLNQVLCLDHR